MDLPTDHKPPLLISTPGQMQVCSLNSTDVSNLGVINTQYLDSTWVSCQPLLMIYPLCPPLWANCWLMPHKRARGCQWMGTTSRSSESLFSKTRCIQCHRSSWQTLNERPLSRSNELPRIHLRRSIIKSSSEAPESKTFQTPLNLTYRDVA